MTPRNSGLWSTDAPVALGHSRRRTPVALWMEKRGLVQRPPSTDESAELGLLLQPVIAQLHTRRTGEELVALDDQELFTEHYGVPMGAHFDYWNDTTKRLHEVKFFAPFRRQEFGEAGSGDVAMDVLVQVIHQFAVWNATRGPDMQAKGVEVSVLFGNFERVLFIVEPDAVTVATLVARLRAFWELVQSNTPPPPRSNSDVQALYTTQVDAPVEATSAVAQAVRQLAQVKVGIAQLEEVQESYEVKIKGFMGQHSQLTHRGELLATWKLDKGRDGYTVTRKAPSRQFRLKDTDNA